MNGEINEPKSKNHVNNGCFGYNYDKISNIENNHENFHTANETNNNSYKNDNRSYYDNINEPSNIFYRDNDNKIYYDNNLYRDNEHIYKHENYKSYLIFYGIIHFIQVILRGCSIYISFQKAEKENFQFTFEGMYVNSFNIFLFYFIITGYLTKNIFQIKILLFLIAYAFVMSTLGIFIFEIDPLARIGVLVPDICISIIYFIELIVTGIFYLKLKINFEIYYSQRIGLEIYKNRKYF